MQQEVRFQRLMEDLLLIDVHQHPMVLAADATEMPAYFRGNAYGWGFEAVKAGGWSAVAAANLLSRAGKGPEGSVDRFARPGEALRNVPPGVQKQSRPVQKIPRAPD